MDFLCKAFKVYIRIAIEINIITNFQTNNQIHINVDYETVHAGYPHFLSVWIKADLFKLQKCESL